MYLLGSGFAASNNFGIVANFDEMGEMTQFAKLFAKKIMYFSIVFTTVSSVHLFVKHADSRRDGRVVEGARLESVYTSKRVSGVRIPLSPHF
jgi:hypothetical protein